MNNIAALNSSIVRPLIIKWGFGRKALVILGLGIITSLLIFYIFQVNEMTRAGFFISNYENEIAELSQGNTNLEIGFSQTNSLANLEALLNSLNYEKVGKVYYIRAEREYMVLSSEARNGSYIQSLGRRGDK